MDAKEILTKHFKIEFGHEGHGDFMPYIINAMQEYAEHQSNLPSDKETVKKLCTTFYYWWHNQKGTNTEEGFETWWKDNGKKITDKSHTNQSQWISKRDLKVIFDAGIKCKEAHPDDDSYDNIHLEKAIKLIQPPQ